MKIPNNVIFFMLLLKNRYIVCDGKRRKNWARHDFFKCDDGLIYGSIESRRKQHEGIELHLRKVHTFAQINTDSCVKSLSVNSTLIEIIIQYSNNTLQST